MFEMSVLESGFALISKNRGSINFKELTRCAKVLSKTTSFDRVTHYNKRVILEFKVK